MEEDTSRRKKPTEARPDEQRARTPQERAYDEVVRGRAGVDMPPGPQDALTQDVADAEPPNVGVDDRAARAASNDVRKREHTPERHADPGFRSKGG